MRPPISAADTFFLLCLAFFSSFIFTILMVIRMERGVPKRQMKSAVKSFLVSHPHLLPGAAAVYKMPTRFLSLLRRTEAGCIAGLAARKADVFFLQIGAHDGRTDDHLYAFVQRYRWKGILVEPVRDIYLQLVANYKGVDGLIFENKAVADVDGSRTFYRLPSNDGQHWSSMIGSLHRDIVRKNTWAAPDLQAHIVEETVECTTVEGLVQRHSVSNLDLILIDTEGYDFEILRQIDFVRFHPELVIYEQTHLSAPDKRKAIKFLNAHGYDVHRLGVGLNNVAMLREHGR